MIRHKHSIQRLWRWRLNEFTRFLAGRIQAKKALQSQRRQTNFLVLLPNSATPSLLWTMGNISSNTDERKRLSVEATGDRGDDRGTDSGNNLALLLDVLGVGEEEADSINNAPLGVNEFTDLLLSCGARDSLTLDRTRRLATNKFAEAEESTVGLIDLFDEVIADIAHYLLPPDVYSLCLTSKRFHRPTTLPTSPEYLELGGNAPAALLSTRLLRISLLDR